MKSPKMYPIMIWGFFSLSLFFSALASATPSQCIQCHSSKERLQAIAKLIPEKFKPAEAEGTG